MDKDVMFQRIWEFVRGDMPTDDFEQLLYNNSSFESYLGKELYFRTVENNYKNNNSTYELRKLLKTYQSKSRPTDCKCVELSNLSIIDIEEGTLQVFKSFDLVKKRGEPYWWLGLYQCKKCRQYWLVAEESRQNDVEYLLRLNKSVANTILTENTWPPIFDTYENLLRIGRDAEKKVRFADPLDAKSLRWTIEELAKERPGIKTSQLAELLNLDVSVAVSIAKDVVKETNVTINFD